MAHQDLPPTAPSSPRIQRIYKQLTTLGCAPAMLGGMLAVAYRPAVTIGFGLTLALGLPILLQVTRLRRDNQRRWDEARRRALAEGLVVKTALLENGDHDYRLLSQAEFDRERWGDDLESWAATRSAPEPESPNGSGPEDA